MGSGLASSFASPRAYYSTAHQLPKVLADALATAPDEQDSGEFEGVEFILVDDSEITF